MMDASLDTDVVIHLYGSGKEKIIYHFFDQLYMHAFLYERELKRKAPSVFKLLDADVKSGRIRIITNTELMHMGVQGLFEGYKRDYEYLFDHGELNAVALAKSMGLAAFVSDDIKQFGPHDTLVKELILDVMPFAFYELLFLQYLLSILTLEELHREFTDVTSKTMRMYPMNYRSKMLNTVRRFSRQHGTQRDHQWLLEYCKKHNIDLNCKLRELKKQLLSS